MIPELMGHRKAVGYWLSLIFFFPLCTWKLWYAATGMARMSALLAETGISGAAWNPGKEVYSGTDGNDPRYPFGDDLVRTAARWEDNTCTLM